MHKSVLWEQSWPNQRTRPFRWRVLWEASVKWMYWYILLYMEWERGNKQIWAHIQICIPFQRKGKAKGTKQKRVDQPNSQKKRKGLWDVQYVPYMYSWQRNDPLLSLSFFWSLEVEKERTKVHWSGIVEGIQGEKRLARVRLKFNASRKRKTPFLLSTPDIDR